MSATHPTDHPCPRCGACEGEPCEGRRPRADDAHSERRALSAGTADVRLDVQDTRHQSDGRQA